MRSIQPVHPLVDFNANKLHQGRMAKDHGVTRLGTLNLALGLDNCFFFARTASQMPIKTDGLL